MHTYDACASRAFTSSEHGNTPLPPCVPSVPPHDTGRYAANASAEYTASSVCWGSIETISVGKSPQRILLSICQLYPRTEPYNEERKHS